MPMRKLPRKNIHLATVIENIIQNGTARTQQEISKYLKSQGIAVNQSSISRALRKIGAVKSLDQQGRAFYRIPNAANHIGTNQSIKNLVNGIDSNEALIMVHTRTGSANVVAQLIDEQNFPELMGTLAGDCEIMVVPKSMRFKNKLLADLQKFLELA